MDFKDREKNEKIIQVMKDNGARALIYFFIFTALLFGYLSFLQQNPYTVILPILIIMFIHFFSIRFVPKKKQSLLNYAPIWSSVSVFAVVLVFISEMFIGMKK